MTERKRNIYISGGIFFTSLIFLIWIIPIFTPPYPGYGISSALLPNIVFSIILGLSLLSMIRDIISTWKEKQDDNRIKTSTQNKIHPQRKRPFGHIVTFMIPCILLMPAMNLLGFIPAGFLFLLLMQYLCGQKKALMMFIVAICVVAVVYCVMRYGLGAPMP